MSTFSYVVDAVAELHSLLPDSILFGSLFLYFLTHHLAFGVFSLFLVEVIAAHRLTAWLFSQSVGPTKSSGPLPLRCRAGFKTIQYQYARIFTHESYPSYSIFSVSAIAAYLGLSTSAFAPTMKEMGADWSMRSTLAYLFIALFLFAFVLTRLFTCEGVTEVLIAVLIGILVGTLSFSIHQAVFGIESVNFLGLPYMIRKDKEGDAIYVCSRTGSV
jgi:hypothetical protein